MEAGRMVEFIMAANEWSLWLGGWVLTYVLHSTVLLGGVWLVSRGRR